jgi:hypothetical protein
MRRNGKETNSSKFFYYVLTLAQKRRSRHQNFLNVQLGRRQIAGLQIFKTLNLLNIPIQSGKNISEFKSPLILIELNVRNFSQKANLEDFFNNSDVTFIVCLVSY